MDIIEIAQGSKEYPALLERIADPPKRLYIRGHLAVLERPSIAIVGSRQATSYGQKMAEIFADGLARAGFTIVSGLAYGVDSWAHLAAVEIGPCVGVLAGGLEAPLMQWQQKITARILEHGGAVVSENPPTTPALKYHFPRRNRIIAGLAYATIVIEAGDKSGALITANAAATANRLVFALPGDVTRPTSIGCNKLIRDGAILVRNPQDVLDELLPQLSPSEIKQIQACAPASANSDFVRVLSQKSMSFEDLAVALSKPAPEVLATLTELELDGAVKRQTDGKFIATS